MFNSAYPDLNTTKEYDILTLSWLFDSASYVCTIVNIDTILYNFADIRVSLGSNVSCE